MPIEDELLELKSKPERILEAIPLLISEIGRWKNLLIINKSYKKKKQGKTDIYDILEKDYLEINNEYLKLIKSIKLKNPALKGFLELFNQKMLDAEQVYKIKMGQSSAVHGQIIDENHRFYKNEKEADRILERKIKELIKELVSPAEFNNLFPNPEPTEVPEEAPVSPTEEPGAPEEAPTPTEPAPTTEASPTLAAEEQDLQALANIMFKKKEKIIEKEEELNREKKLLEYLRTTKIAPRLVRSTESKIKGLETVVNIKREDFESSESSIPEGMSEEQKNELFKLLQDKLRELYLKKAIDANGIIAKNKKSLREIKLNKISIREKIRKLKAKNTLSDDESEELDYLEYKNHFYEEQFSSLNQSLTDTQELFYYFLQKADEYNKPPPEPSPAPTTKLVEFLIERVRDSKTIEGLYAGFI